MIFGKGLVGNKGRFCDSEEHTQLMAKNAKFIPPKEEPRSVHLWTDPVLY